MAFYDSLETRDPAEREASLFAHLPEQIAHAQSEAPGFARILAGVAPKTVTDRAALAQLPVTRKSALIQMQAEAPPFGGLAAGDTSVMARVFQSPGPIFEPQGRRPDHWRMARALFAAGIRAGMLIHNTFSYHFTPAGAMVESAAEALGCPVFPAGVGQTELQVEAIARLRPAAYVGTPSFLGIIIDKAEELGRDVSSIKHALVTGEALPASLRERLQARGMTVRQCYATADLGLIAYETEAREGLVVDEGVILEIVRPGSNDPVAAGEVGEVVVTTFNREYPLIRFGTGDLSALLAGTSPCGRTNQRIKGWMGRADQTAKVRGMFVHPEQVDQVIKRQPGISRARLEISNPEGRDHLVLKAEGEGIDTGALAEAFREQAKVRCEVETIAAGTLPNDGKVIDDQRSYD